MENPTELMPGMKIYGFEDLIKFVTSVYNEKDEYYVQRELVLKKMFCYLDGNSSQRLAEHMGL